MKKYTLICCLFTGFFARAQNVGIGTNSPISKLTIQTPLNTAGYTHIGGTNEVIVTETIGGVSASFGTSTNHALRLHTNNMGRISIYPAGEVVIGSNNFAPLGKFAVESSPGNFGITNSDGTIILSTFLGGSSPFAYLGTQTNHALSFFTNNSLSQAILLPNGNFGIGTTSPVTKLHVAGAARVDGNGEFYGAVGIAGSVGIKTASNAAIGLNILHDNEAIRITGNQSFITFNNGANYKGYLWNKGVDDMELGTAGVNTNGRLLLSIKGTPYFTMHSNGRISINGPAANFAVNYVSMLTVNGPIVLKDFGSNFNEWGLNSHIEDLVFMFNGSTKAVMDIDGDLISFSDARLKDNVEAYRPVMDGIRKLAVSTYHYKTNAQGSRSFGLIAQNVAEYFPEIVSETTDQNGNKTLGVAYAKTGVIAIKAIQEQQKIIEQQQEEINDLKKRLIQLEKLMAEKLK